MITDRLSLIREALPLRRVDRYLMRHFLISWSICALAILGLFMVIEGLSRIERFMRQEEGLLVILVRYFSAIIPIFFCKFFGPVLTMLAAMFATTQLNKGNELIPLRLAGLSTARILAPFFLLAFLSAGGMIALQEAVIPNMKDLIRTATSYSSNKKAIRPDLVADGMGALIDVDQYLPAEKRGTMVLVENRHASNSHPESFIKAEEISRVEPTGGEAYWLLTNGYIQRWEEDGQNVRNPDAQGEDVYLQWFDQYRLKTDMQPIDLESSDQEIEYLSFSELRDQIKRRQEQAHLEVKLHLRFAFPLANFILLLLGLPLVLKGENRSVVVGVLLAIGISAVYLLATMICADLGNRGLLTPLLAAWLPVLFFGALGLTMFDSVDST